MVRLVFGLILVCIGWLMATVVSGPGWIGQPIGLLFILAGIVVLLASAWESIEGWWNRLRASLTFREKLASSVIALCTIFVIFYGFYFS